MRRTITIGDVEAEIERLPDLDPDALRIRWRELTGKPPGPGLKGELLRRALAQTIQERAFGGLSPGVAKRLAVLNREYHCTGQDGESAKSNGHRRIKPGSRLIREWKGMVHEVIVLPDGYFWDGDTHKALSTIAREITGTHWNGWTFFGLGGSTSAAGRVKKQRPPAGRMQKTAEAEVTAGPADA